jgi:hypothetical protein
MRRVNEDLMFMLRKLLARPRGGCIASCKGPHRFGKGARDTLLTKLQKLFVHLWSILCAGQIHYFNYFCNCKSKKITSRECVLFIGTQYSNLYTAMDTPAEAAWFVRTGV